ncbi:family 1 glycosylhydrolase [Streptomyces microflavus]|uniref:family 1 glycosylhydrolase n=1 Tax=Streptomyces microflavus TaxID=1919 RepID=UPI0037F7E3F2
MLLPRRVWPQRDTTDHFSDYAAVLAGALGDPVPNSATLNEPLCFASLGDLEDVLAPGLKDPSGAVRAWKSHEVLKPNAGIVFNITPCDPATDRRAARRVSGLGAKSNNRCGRWWTIDR